MTEPKQKPGRSKQDYGTPPEFLVAVKAKLGIADFDFDLAASHDNAVTDLYFIEHDNALTCESWKCGDGWNWLNPPYGDIEPWVAKAYREWFAHDAQTAMLIPAAVGTNWWREWVHRKCRVLLLNGRLTFVGHTAPFPKDCALLLYASTVPFVGPEYDVWTWKSSRSARVTGDPLGGVSAKILSVESGKAMNDA